MKKKLLYLVKLFLLLIIMPIISNAQMMHNGSVTICNSTFIDDGGELNNYGNSKDYTLTVYPNSTNTATRVHFEKFEINGFGDWLKIYDGNSTSSPLIGVFSGSTSPNIFISTAVDGSLTFVFHSDASVNAEGWEANLSCVPKISRIFVDTNGSDSGDGTSWLNACTLTKAIAIANDGDEIWVAKGIYTGTYSATGKNIKLYGGFNPSANPKAITDRLSGDYSTLVASPNKRILDVDGIFTLDGFIFQGGKALDNDGGGAICIYGRGISSFITNCKFINNYSFYNGGAVSFKMEQSETGARTVFMDRCVFSGNSADMSGGAIAFSPGTGFGHIFFYLTNSLLSGNAAKGTNTDVSSFPIVSQPDLSGTGGAIYSFSPNRMTVDITNCTIAGNFASRFNGGISIETMMNQITLNNSIISNNSNDILVDNTFGNPLYYGSNNIFTDPKFENAVSPNLAPTLAGSYSLSDCSPAINAANNNLYTLDVNSLSITGNIRFFGQLDIGAYEYQGQPSNGNAILYVDKNTTYNQNSNNVGSAGNKAIQDLGLALLYASLRDCTVEIRVAEGQYHPSINDRSAFFWATNGRFNIKGGYPTGFTSDRNPNLYPTIFSGNLNNDADISNNSYHLLILSSTETQLYGNIIDGITFENAYADQGTIYNDIQLGLSIPQNQGAAVYINKVAPTFRNCVFKSNQSYAAGGAILINDHAKPIFESCNFEFNVSAFGAGGAIKIQNQSNVTFRNCIFNFNIASGQNGGAVLIDNSYASFYNTKFINNFSEYGDGGAIHHQNGGSLTLEKSVFIGNQAKYGGAVRTLGGDINFNANANVFTDNIAHENGAGALSIIPGNGKTVITNNVFTGNKTALGLDNQPSGGASIVQEGGSATYVINNTFFNEKAYAGSSSVHFKSGGSERYLQNNIFYQNTSTAGGNLPNWNLGSSTTAASSNNLENINPMFVNASDPDGADNTWGTADDGLRLLSSSPAINQGIATNAAANDILGAARLQDGAIDLGAYEMAPTVLPVNLSSFTAKLENNTAVLRWETSSEKNNDTFEIFRSADAKTYTSLGTVNGKETTSTKNNYTFADRQPLNGINYYKLVQKDVDGKTEELGIRPLTFSFNGEEVLLYPNPVKEKANVRFSAGTYNNIILSDISGKTLQTLKLNKLETEKAIAMNNLANGTYFLRLQGDSKNATVKIIKN